MANMMAGSAQYDMTPPRGVRLAGYPHFPRPNEGFHDPLYATCIYMCDKNASEIAIITLDILFFSKKYAAQARSRINREYGLPEKNILICCSHTHSGPWAAGNPELEASVNGDGKDIDVNYLDSLINGIVSLVGKAKESAFLAEVGFGTGICGAERGVGGNRMKKDGICDPSVNVLAIKDMSGAVRAAIVNYALHPTFLHEDNMLVSADYPNYVRVTLNQYYPHAVIGFSQGASGDQSSRYFRKGQSFDEAERVGSLIGETAAGVIDKMAFVSEPSIKTAHTELPIEIRKYPPISELEEKVRRKTDEYKQLAEAGASYLDVQNANLRMLGAEDMLGYALCVNEGKRIDLRDDENPAEVSAFKIGDYYIVGLQGEIFTEFSLKIKSRMDTGKIFVFELADGCLPGYCYTHEALEGEFYEVGNSMLTPDYGDVLVKAALGLIGILEKE